MGIFINGVDVSKSPFGDGNWSGRLSDLFKQLDKPVDTGRDGVMRVWDQVEPGNDWS